MLTLQIVKSLRFGELAANSNSPIFSVAKPWRVSRVYRMCFMYTECVYKFTACFTECFLFCVDLVLYLYISHVYRKLNITEHT